MLSEWEIITLKKAGVILIDCDHKTPKAQEVGLPYIGIPQLKEGQIITDTARLISKEDFQHWRRKAKPTANDIILSRRCNPGVTAYVPDGLEIALGQNLVLLRSDGKLLYPPFLRWVVKGSDWWKQVSKFINVGAVFESLRCAHIPSFEIKLPPLPTQKKIAHILSTLDDKIELNRKMNQTLEEMAQALFKSWFVDFDPVHARATCGSDAELERVATELGITKEILELFPSEFEESEMGLIPKGWKFEELGNLTNITSSKRIFSREYTEKGVPFYRSKEIIQLAQSNAISDILYISKERFAEIKSKFLVPKAQDILITSVGTIGKIYLVPDDAPFYFKDGNLTWINDYIDITPIFIYNFLRSDNAQRQIDSVLIGSTQKALTIVNINKLSIVKSSLVVLEEFTKQTQSIFNQITINTEQTRVLEQARDTLLPKLLSGELDVSNIEIEAD